MEVVSADIVLAPLFCSIPFVVVTCMHITASPPPGALDEEERLACSQIK